VFSSGEVNGSAQLRWLVTNVTGVSKGAAFPNQINTQYYYKKKKYYLALFNLIKYTDFNMGE
jgi:hypothetical protein